MKNPFKSKSFTQLALLVFFNAIFLVLSPFICFFPEFLFALLFGLDSDYDPILLTIRIVLCFIVPFILGRMLGKKANRWWLLSIPFQFLIHVSLVYIWNCFADQPAQIFSIEIMTYIAPALIGQAVGIVVRLLHLKQELP